MKLDTRIAGHLVLLGIFILSIVMCASGAHAQGVSGFNDPGARGASAAGGGGDLAPVEPTVDGGGITVGATAQVVVLFRNDSGRRVQTGAIQLYPSSTVSASVSLNQCASEDLPAGASCAVALSVKGLQAGAWRIEMIMRHSGRSRLVTTTLNGQIETGEGSDNRFVSDVEAIPSELDFGSLDDSSSSIRPVVLRNTTSEAIDLNAIYIEASEQSGYSLRTDCTRLEPGQACLMTVTWSPILKGSASGVLVIEHSGPTSIASITLNGDFAPSAPTEAEIFPDAVPGKGLLVSSRATVDFGSGIESISAITVSLVNVGDAPLTIQDVRMASSDSAGISVSKSGCVPDMVLGPVEACALTLSWAPTREGQILDDVQILHDGARGILVLPVRGTATDTISQDAKPVRLASGGTISASLDGGGTDGMMFVRDDTIDPGSILDGFIVTSHSARRAIISGPGGSRIVFNGEEVVLGGVLWDVAIRGSGVQFQTGDEKVLLLFDRSLSSVNQSSRQSSGGLAAQGGN